MLVESVVVRVIKRIELSMIHIYYERWHPDMIRYRLVKNKTPTWTSIKLDYEPSCKKHRHDEKTWGRCETCDIKAEFIDVLKAQYELFVEYGLDSGINRHLPTTS